VNSSEAPASPEFRAAPPPWRPPTRIERRVAARTHLTGVLLSVPLLFLEVGGYLLLVILVLGLVMPFAAAEQCREGRDFRYPLIIRLVR